MILTNTTNVKVSLTHLGYKVMDEFLSKKLEILYNYKNLAGDYNDPNVDDDIKYIEKIRIIMLGESFDLAYQDFIQIFPYGIDPKYIKDGKIDILEE